MWLKRLIIINLIAWKKKRDHPGGQYQSGFDQLTGTEEYHQGATWKHFP